MRRSGETIPSTGINACGAVLVRSSEKKLDDETDYNGGDDTNNDWDVVASLSPH
jgi:hypothetical protein